MKNITMLLALTAAEYRMTIFRGCVCTGAFSRPGYKINHEVCYELGMSS